MKNLKWFLKEGQSCYKFEIESLALFSKYLNASLSRNSILLTKNLFKKSVHSNIIINNLDKLHQIK